MSPGVSFYMKIIEAALYEMQIEKFSQYSIIKLEIHGKGGSFCKSIYADIRGKEFERKRQQK